MTAKKINKIEITGMISNELKELTSSVSKMMEAFRQIRKPIVESVKKVPTTAQQLEKVTEQTEQATNRVLDMVEAINNRESEISEWVSKIKELIPREVLSASNELESLMDKVGKNTVSNLNDLFNIMDAMQFQDITTQQVDHAITLLDDVEDRLMSLLNAIGNKNGIVKNKGTKKQRAFDPNAEFTVEDKKQQREIDDIIKNR
ncbi:MAG: protein phosphatase CheZ [candidate division Zixibacteria bacterium]|nr:protein phosphatase CheZ [candidate division Zixibacteria bacterium]